MSLICSTRLAGLSLRSGISPDFPYNPAQLHVRKVEAARPIFIREQEGRRGCMPVRVKTIPQGRLSGKGHTVILGAREDL